MLILLQVWLEAVWSVHSSGVCEELQCWEVPQHPPTSLLMGLFLLEGEEKVVS